MVQRFFILSSILFTLCITGFSQTPLTKRIDSLFIAYLDSGLAGSLLVAEQNKVTLKKAYGYSNNETKTLNTTSTLFNVASIGKHFTVYALLKLEEQGLLSTNDYLSKYTGPFNDVRDSITIHHVLIHRSGLIKDGAAIDYSTRNKFIETIKKGPADSIPGKKYRYSNAGYTMLAAVVEIITKQPFEEYLLKNIFEPRGMKNTGYPWEPRMDKSLFATGYNGQRQPVTPQPDFWGARGPGNLVTSMEDLFIWMQAFQDDKFVSPTMRAKVLYDYFPGEDGYAWNKALTNRKTRFFHKGGGRADFENRLLWFPDDGVVIIFSLNNDYNLARQLFIKVRGMMN